MQGNNSGNQGGQNNSSKQSGLSWSQPNSAKPVSSIGTSVASQPKSAPMLKPATPPAPAGSSRKLAMLFAGGILVGGLLAWSWFSLNPESTVAEEEVTPGTGAGGAENTGGASGSTNGTLPGATIGNETLVVPAQQDAGLSVMVSSATVSAPTWVVVYESQNGARGNALGAALFFPNGGAKTINLLRATTAGRVYLVGRHVDNGDKQFSLTNDRPVVNAAGNPAYIEFRTR